MSDRPFFITQGIIVSAIVLLSLSFSGCEVIGDIFKAGLWVGIIVVVLIIAGIAAIVRMLRK